MIIKLTFPLLVASLFVGCASVPKADQQLSQSVKELTAPQEGKAGLYVYRSNNIVGSALKKDIWVDGECLGETARGIFFYKEVEGNTNHTVSTESEFSPNHLKVETQSGKNYFIQQYIKPGVFVGGAALKLVDDIQGKKAVSEYNLATIGKCSKPTIQITD